MKRRLKAIIVIASLLIFIIVPTITNAATDISGHPFESDIRVLLDGKMISGYKNGEFKPNSSITRAEFITILVKVLGSTSRSKEIKYEDVPGNAWYYDPVKIAWNAGLLSESKHFNPNDNITREEMAAFITRALSTKGIQGKPAKLDFADETEIASFFIPSVQQLVGFKIIGGSYNGKGELIFAPKKSTTRGETAAILNRTMKTIEAYSQLVGAGTISTNTYYNLDYNAVVDIQASRSPKLDGKGIFTASKELTEYYLNPANVDPKSNAFLQFLILSENADLNATEVNEKILKGKGALEGQAEAFIEAGRMYHINEVYLIAHALHETGNGASTLAKGVNVTAINGKAVTPKVTYNMFGIGAVDACPVGCGSQRAYQESWFTPRDAIIGGAKFIGDKYINAGQNTLYKMRWNPDKPGTHQYATHVMWAELQTKKMHDIYQQLDTYTHKFDVPVYNNQRGISKIPTGEAMYAVTPMKLGLTGVVTLNKADPSLNMRSGPTTAFPIIDQLARNTVVTIIGENGGWYKVTVNGKTGWLSAGYVKLPGTMKASSFEAQVDNDTPIFDLNAE